MPKLSFIVPIFEPRPSFDKCVKSLLSQSLEDIEIICVLDGPSSIARSVLSKYVSSKINIVEIPHGGACRARNEGFKHSQSPYVVFWDSDCVIEPGSAKMWVDLFDKKPEIGFIYSGYKFDGMASGIASNPWDPFLLRVRNFISSCFPVRRELVCEWGEELKSLQDWDFWLSVTEHAKLAGYDENKVGHFVKGYAFTTDFPTAKSISGEGCRHAVWLERFNAVKKRHNIESKPVCVASLDHNADGVMLAKMIGADFQVDPSDKPNEYKTIIQIGMSLLPNRAVIHANIFSNPEQKKYLFWTNESITTIYKGIDVEAMVAYKELLNASVTQFVEDIAAEKLMTKIGFNVSILPLPIMAPEKLTPLPEKPIWAVDCDRNYGEVMVMIDKSLPDITLEMLDNNRKLAEITGVIHLFADKSTSNTIKRALLNGRHVISNVQAPFCGYVDDSASREDFIVKIVDKIRGASIKPQNHTAIDYYRREATADRLLRVLS